ncbi:carbon-nitrogen hydrolase family protein [Gammaproteobacteria bacterium]|nr:carbon-nitrogen hydrolase family protein [Gammaproteobacteria bacterium]MDC0545790.1 carbon-nitrogen hydrolase family protein [Gammaproteobacteria bacterium]
MSTFSIAGLQLELNYSNNLKSVTEAISQTSKRYPWIQMIVVSELAIGGASRSQDFSLDNNLEHFQSLAKKLNIWLIPGSFYHHEENQITNIAPVISCNGELITLCTKIYPFLPYEKGISGGTESCIFEVPDVGIFGMHICYDLWFPETSRALAMQGAEVIIHPSLTDTCDRNEEKIMARATAIQQQCFYVDINSSGEQGCGQSTILGPEGEVLTEAGTGEETLLIEVDFKRVNRVRCKGIKGLGQPLKSFRDNRNPVHEMSHNEDYLNDLGPLEMPKK